MFYRPHEIPRKEAEEALASTLSGIGKDALSEGLTETDVARMIDEPN